MNSLCHPPIARSIYVATIAPSTQLFELIHAVGSGGHLCTDSLCILIVTRLNASQMLLQMGKINSALSCVKHW